MIAFVHSRTCVTLPGDELRSVKFIVWMESIITISGFSVRMCSTTSCTSVSAKMRRLGLETPRRPARSLICRADSSPETYRIRSFCPRYSQICKRMVDLPIPGSPLMSTSEPFTRPPPSTRSSSESPV